MHSGQLGRLSGVSTDTLRHYERLGLLPVPRRSAGNYREYTAASLQQVQLVRRALSIGFSLREMKTILGVRERGGLPCRQVRARLREKIRDIELRLKSLVLMRAELMRISKDWDRRLSRAPKGQAAHLLEALPAVLHVAPRSRLWRTGKLKGE